MSAAQNKLLAESKLLLRLAIPLIMGSVAETAIGFFSNIFLAHLSTASLAAGALVNWVFTTIMVIAWGTFSAVTTLAARYHGAKNDTQNRCVLYAGLLLALLCMLPAMLLLWHLAPIFLFFGQNPSTVLLAQAYLHGLTWAIIPDFIITVLLQFVAGLGRTKTNLVFSLLFVPTNIFFNYGLMFGKFGLPDLGIAGIGWGAALSFWIISTGFIIYFGCNKSYRVYLPLPHWQKIRLALQEILQVGFPLGLMYCVEVGFFLAMTLVMGMINENTLSANQVTLQFYWLFSIVSFSWAQGITIRVGHSMGSHNKKAVNYATYLGSFYTCLFTLFPMVLYWFFAKEIISLDFNLQVPSNAITIHLATEFLAIAALVQFVEAIRFAFFGALRGLKDTRFTLVISIFIYWMVTLPLCYLLGIVFKMEGAGIWWATLLGQIIGTPLLIWRYRRKVVAYFL
jgi:multidrug resistance protein, MATE family